MLVSISAVGAEVEPEEDRVAKVVEAAAGRSCVEVDDPDRLAVAEYEVARREIVVADRLLVAGERRTGGGVVKATDEPRRLYENVI